MNEKIEFANRQKLIVKTSLIGIIVNVAVAGFKFFVGMITGSIAITMDAVNNFSDALSSIITIIGTKLAGRMPDKKHPYGHGRIEYITAVVIAVIVLYAGITALIESIQVILHPITPSYPMSSLLIIVVAVVVKLLLGLFIKKQGERVSSESLIGTGKESILDSIISIATLIAAVVYIFTGLKIEAYLGAAISLLIIKTGIDILRETLSHILGKRASKDLINGIKRSVRQADPRIHGVYDVMLHDYGPDVRIGSLHVEVDDTLHADEVDNIIRHVTNHIYQEHKVLLGAVGIYSKNTKGGKAAALENQIRRMVMEHNDVMQMHGFYFHEDEGLINFDMILTFDAKDRYEQYEKIVKEVEEAFPEYRFGITLDLDASD